MNRQEIVLLTGATGKLGKQFLEYFLNANYKVVITSRYMRNIEDLYERYKYFYENKMLTGICINLEDEDALNKLLEFINKESLHPSILVNNARNSEYLKKEKDYLLQRKQWIGEFLVDIIVPYELSMGLAYYNNTKLRNIINISSMYGVVAPNPLLYDNFQDDSPINYGVCKSAMIHLTKELAVRLANREIQVNTISYGGVEGRVDEYFKNRYSKLCPQGRMLKDEEVIGAIQFLSSEASKGMTGHNLIVDGGWTVW